MAICKVLLCSSCNLHTLLSYTLGSREGRPPGEAFKKGQLGPHPLLTELDVAEARVGRHPWYPAVPMTMLHPSALISHGALVTQCFRIPCS